MKTPLFNSFRIRVFVVITLLVLITALCISGFQQWQLEDSHYSTELVNAQNLLKMATVHIENQYESYLFYRESLINERKRHLKDVIGLIFIEMETLYAKVQTGELSTAEAQESVLECARRLRYMDGSGYIWVNNTEYPYPRLIMHPTLPELEWQNTNKDIYNTARGKGDNLFTAFVEVCRENDHGYVDYHWPKPTASGLSTQQPKLSFVRLFKPWGWIVGTGVYLDDIEKDSHLRIEAIIRELRNAFRKIRITENSYLYVFDGSYNVLVHPDYEGRTLAELKRPAAEKNLMNELMASAKSADKAMSYTWEKPNDARKGHKYNKMALVHHFAPLDWYIVASLCVDELNEPFIALRWKILIIISILLTLSLVLASMLAKNLSQPLQRLAEAAGKIETDGIHTVEIPVTGTSETIELGNCLRSMLHSIKCAAHDRDILFHEIQSEEEKHRITLDSIADAVIPTDTSGKILRMNPMAETLTGWTHTEAFEQDISEVYRVSVDGHSVENPVDRILNNNRHVSTNENIILLARGGKEYHIAEQGSPIRNENGEVKGIVLVFHNITEEFLNKQKLKEAEWKFHALFEYSPIGVAYHRMIYDKDGNPADYYFIDANSNYLELSGVDPRGKTVKEVFPDIDKDTVDWIEIFGKVAKTGEPKPFQHFQAPNGRWYDGVAFQYKPDHFVVALLEITEQLKLEQQLRQAQKMDAIGQLAGGIAHDFNNVLSGIVGAAELLILSAGEDPQTRKLLGIIQESSGRATNLIRKLLTFGRQTNLTSVQMDAHDAVREAVAILECSIDKKIRIQLKLAAESSYVAGDPAQLQSVFINMGINASHAMPDGGLLSIESENTALDKMTARAYDLEPGSYLKLAVRDTGTGIKAEDLPRIFEPFFTTKDPGKGTGLGLSASFGIIKQHHGAISVYSEMGVGSVFQILLPLIDMAKPLSDKEEKPVQGHGCILVIDDEQIITFIASAILDSLGYDVLVAQNGSEGIKIYENEHEKIDLVLLDMIMPEMNGRECFEKLKEIDPKVKVILTSGFSKDSDFQQMQDKGLSGFIHKPYGLVELSHMLKKVMHSQAPDE